ncbi:BTAD domain-containing putative transcriptional regulator [Streptosporangium sp. NPDC002524]|uniref:BTAD domain-containing putative transcriptional regulator n=1 Tax=Streptosporangium sp. NPDC002524 TaxID=3154537 RepID=UPI00332EA902
MRFDILGPTRIRLDGGRVVVVGGQGMRALLVMLLLDAGRVVITERLIGGLYGDDPPASAANALQSQVSRLRRALGVQEMVEFHPAGYRLAADPGTVDAHRFERLAAEGRRAVASGEHGRAVELLGEALSLWRGPALADVAEAPFAQAPSARLERLRLDCVEDRVQAELELGRHRELVAELQELTAAHPFRERLYGQLMRALYGSGRQAEALEVYEGARRILGEEFGVDPSAELAAVHLAVLRADPALTGALTGASTGVAADGAGPGPVRSGLWAPLTSFVGRESEMSRLRALLGEARLVTLVGPGGAGKTRLAGEVAARERGDVCFVELAPVLGEGEAAQAVLGALGARDAGLLPARGRPVPAPLDRLVAVLADRPVLLVLDNCEHLVAEVAELADRLLAVCPGLRVLVTSREALGITGEVLHPVAPLPVPRTGTAAGEALTYPAVRLFADRAAAVRPGFRVDDANVEQVLGICHALDGLPLALELAAARLRSLPVAEVASRLDDRFRLLSRGSRTALPRHQTLRAVVAWSWDLLDDDERSLAGRLTVFVGGATLEAAGRVCGLREDEAVDLLSSLAEKSLVERVGERYRMLETIRAYCAERLAETGETEARREAHAAYYADLAATADSHLRDAGQLEWLRRLDEERDDLHAALRWAVDTGRIARGLRLLAGLAMYWWLRGRRSEGAALAADLLAAIGHLPTANAAGSVEGTGPAPAGHMPGESAPGSVEGTELTTAGYMPAESAAGSVEGTELTPAEGPAGYLPVGSTAGSVPGPFERMRALAPVEGMEEEYAICVLVSSSGESRSPRHPTLMKTIVSIIPPLDRPYRWPFLAMLWPMFTGPPDFLPKLPVPAIADPWLQALSHFGYGYFYRDGGHPESAAHAFEKALELFRSIGERWGSALTLAELAGLADLRRDRAASRALGGEALRLAEELGSDEDIAELVCREAAGIVRDGDLATAHAEYLRAAGHARRAGAPDVMAKVHCGLAEVARLRGDLDEARAIALRALELCTQGWYTIAEIRLRITVELGRIAVSGGDGPGARTWYLRALEPSLRRYSSVAASVIEGLAEVTLLEGDAEGAARLLGAATAFGGTAAAAPDADVTAAVRARTGDAAYEKEWHAGNRMSRGEVLAMLTS